MRMHDQLHYFVYYDHSIIQVEKVFYTNFYNRFEDQVESLRHLSKGLDSFRRLRQLELIANYVVEASIPTMILFCVIHKDVGNLYKWQTFRHRGLHQNQILHADNNITTIHDIYRVYIDTIRSKCSVINYGWGFVWLEKASQADGLKTGSS